MAWPRPLLIGLYAGFAGVCFVSASAATGPSQNNQLPKLNDVASAEAEASAYPRGDQRLTQRDLQWSGIAGTSERKCTEVGDRDPVRSGEFVAGSFRLMRDHWQRGRSKSWWEPLLLPDGLRGTLENGWLTIRGVRLDQGSAHTEYTADHIVQQQGVGFFNTEFWLPEPGRWMLVATYEANWGCFLITVQ